MSQSHFGAVADAIQEFLAGVSTQASVGISPARFTKRDGL
jgi:hypothetical protein